MSNAAQRILDSIQGDQSAISTLASAIARNDIDGVHRVLRARGVELSDAEVTSVVAGATGSGGQACTCTCTCT